MQRSEADGLELFFFLQLAGLVKTKTWKGLLLFRFSVEIEFCERINIYFCCDDSSEPLFLSEDISEILPTHRFFSKSSLINW